MSWDGKEADMEISGSIEKIHVNIWDDYHDDGFVPDGEVQKAYAYANQLV